MASEKTRFWILIALVSISGFSQGMLLPLLSIILEQNGISSSVNGLHATGLYIGILIASPFMEKPLQKFGYKPLILVGGMLVFVSMAIFPFWQALWFWFILRMVIGIGDQMLHFGTQTWITSTSTIKNRGRNVAYYGLFFALGFMLGPLMTRLLSINEALPFFVSAALSMIVWSSMFFVRNKWPEQDASSMNTANTRGSLGRFIKTVQIAWVALLPGFGYGFLEASLHSIFPIYGMRIGHDVDILALIIPCFAAGSILTQLPLGILSDRIGRKKVLSAVLSFGTIGFIAAAFLENSIPALFILFSLTGMLVGSMYSLGISYMTDLLPLSLLPAGNLMIGISFSLGSISGPILGGLFVEILPGVSFFFLIAGMLILILIALLTQRNKTAHIP